MKYLILLTDGAGDEPIESLGNKTPLETAHMQYINELAHKGVVGMVNTIPEGIAPGSDAANLSVMGYDPKVYHTGHTYGARPLRRPDGPGSHLRRHHDQ